MDFISNAIVRIQGNYSHVYREINSAADFLANYAVAIQGDFGMSPPFIPIKLKAIILLDNICPFVRI